MAYTKILVIHNRLDKCVSYVQNRDKTSLETAIDYALNRAKTEHSCYESALNCDLERVYLDMRATKERWGKLERRRRGYHIIQSFAPGEATPEEAHAIGMELAGQLLRDYEAVITTHLNRAHLHNHIVFNSVSFVDGRMYRDQLRDYYGGIRAVSDELCRAHGLSVIEPDKAPEAGGRGQKPPTRRALIRADIDAALSRAYTYQSFLDELRRMGYQVKAGPNVSHTAVRPPVGQKFLRLDSLGTGYTEAELKERLAALRSGEVPPARAAPACPLLTPGCRYRVQGRLPRRHRPLTGFQALYYKYLYALKAIHKRQRRPPSRTAFSMREELRRLDRYQKQFLYLHRNRIETAGQLAMQYDALQAEIDALTARRAGLYRRRRANPGDLSLSAEIERITARLKALRRDLKLCARIEAEIPTIRAEAERSAAHEKTDQSRFFRRPEPDPRVPAR